MVDKGDGHLESKSAHSQFFTDQVKNYKTVVLCIKYYTLFQIHILHLLCTYFLQGQVTLGERAFGQILTLSDCPSYKQWF